MDHRVSHDLDFETAKRVTNKAFESYSERFSNYSPTLDWVTEQKAKITFTAKGVSLDGNITLHEGAIEMGLDVPFIFKPFKKKAIQIIEDEIQKWIDKARAGEI
jgi:hypothetical protein